jgi:hypothetical protein
MVVAKALHHVVPWENILNLIFAADTGIHNPQFLQQKSRDVYVNNCIAYLTDHGIGYLIGLAHV